MLRGIRVDTDININININISISISIKTIPRRGGKRTAARESVDLHLRVEPIADAMHCVQVMAMLTTLTKGVAQKRDYPVKHPGSDMAVTPDSVQNLVPGKDPSRFADQQYQYRERLRLQRTFSPVDKQPMPDRVDDDVVERQDSVGKVFRRHGES